MVDWAEAQRAGTMKAIECLGARADLAELLGWFDAWLDAIGALDELDRGMAAVHPATGSLADALESADLVCPPSALLRQIEGLHERRMAGSS